MDDGVVHLVAGDPDGMIEDDPVEGDDGDVRGPAADVHDHVPGRLGDGQVGPDGRRHGLLDEIDLGGLGPHGHVLDGPPLDLGDAGRDADDDPRPEEEPAVVHGLLDEEVEHLLGDLEVGDDAVAHGLDGHDAVGVLPSISLARPPTASTFPVSLLTTTIDGSWTMIPFPLRKTRVLAVPRSTARSQNNLSFNQLRMVMLSLFPPGEYLAQFPPRSKSVKGVPGNVPLTLVPDFKYTLGKFPARSVR
jgi:hypothetical protein